MARADRRPRAGPGPDAIPRWSSDGACRPALRPMTEPTIADLLAAAEPRHPRAMRGLIDRLTVEGRLRGARVGGRAIGAQGIGAVEVRGVTDDSRAVAPGALFVAIRGLHVDGHDNVERAAAKGAAAAIVERALPEVALPQLIVDRSPAALASAAAWWYDDPSRGLGVVGIT